MTWFRAAYWSELSSVLEGRIEDDRQHCQDRERQREEA